MPGKHRLTEINMVTGFTCNFFLNLVSCSVVQSTAVTLSDCMPAVPILLLLLLLPCRECCGGMGVLAANKIGPMKNDMDVDVTFEGDNTVMMQQVRQAHMCKTNSYRASKGIHIQPTCCGRMLKFAMCMKHVLHVRAIYCFKAKLLRDG